MSTGKIQIGKTQLNRYSAPLFLLEPVGLNAGERTNKTGFAMVNMACGA
jgi:hypothetical protein